MTRGERDIHTEETGVTEQTERQELIPVVSVTPVSSVLINSVRRKALVPHAPSQNRLITFLRNQSRC